MFSPSTGTSTARRVGRVVLAAVLAATAMAAMQEPAHADLNGCSSNTQNPHFSSGANGVIAKATYVCSAPGVTNLVMQLYLFRCNRNKQADETKSMYVSSAACTEVARNLDEVEPPVVGKTYTRYAPPLSEPGKRGSGWWILQNTWSSCSQQNVVDGHRDFSNIVYIDTSL